MEINLNEIRNEILALNELSDEELLLKLIPQEERHSPNANLERAKNILNQCISRAKTNLIQAYSKHKHTVNFSIDFALYLVPVLASNDTVPPHIIPVLAILIARHGIEFLSKK